MVQQRVVRGGGEPPALAADDLHEQKVDVVAVEARERAAAPEPERVLRSRACATIGGGARSGSSAAASAGNAALSVVPLPPESVRAGGVPGAVPVVVVVHVGPGSTPGVPPPSVVAPVSSVAPSLPLHPAVAIVASATSPARAAACGASTGTEGRGRIGATVARQRPFCLPFLPAESIASFEPLRARAITASAC